MNKYCCRLTADQPRLCRALDDGRTCLLLPDDLGHCRTECLELEHGLLLSRLDYRPTRPLIEESNAPHAEPVMVVTLGLHGSSGYRSTDATSVRFQAGHTTVTAFRAIRGERHYEGTDAVSQLRLIVNETALNKYVGHVHAARLLKGEGLHHLSFHTSSQATMAHVAALTRYMQPTSSPDCRHHRLDLHIHALSLLAEQFNRLAPAAPIGTAALSASDIEHIERARDIMIQQLHQPLTNEYLATAVGINGHKLKEGFRYLYNNTPMGLLLELRMRKAYILLEAGQQVAQAGWQVGYKYPNNFSVAFARYFGRSPKSIFGSKCV